MRLNSKAIALMIVLAIILFLIVLIVIGIKFTLSNTVLSYHTLNKTRGFYFAEAGIQRAIYKLKYDPPPTYPYPEDWLFPDPSQTVTITISDLGSNNYDVVSKCTYESLKKKIQATVNKGSTVRLSDWQQFDDY